jgi:glycine/D-amino acid oxidase-like deaminating enzyme
MEYDYVIVGGGSAGCTVAARLSEDPRLRYCFWKLAEVIGIPCFIGLRALPR